jgi:hypothetical protein
VGDFVRLGQPRQHTVADSESVAKDAATSRDAVLGEQLPEHWCRQCWRDRFVRRDGVWMAEHIGSFSECLHTCHDGETFLESTS